jgi:hypothetical protein
MLQSSFGICKDKFDHLSSNLVLQLCPFPTSHIELQPSLHWIFFFLKKFQVPSLQIHVNGFGTHVAVKVLYD